MSRSFRRDLTGQRFGRLTVLEFVPTKDCYSWWLCKCDCGNVITVAGNHLGNGHTQSCGCLNSDRIRERRYLHGKTGSRVYRVWKGIKARCYNSNSKNYNHYGGRGITVCDEWRNNFKAFYDWAMSNGYDDKLTIDRIDVNGNYAPYNCRWVDMTTQNRNKRDNTIIEYNGKKMCLKDASELSGIPYITLVARYYRGDRGERLFRPLRK